MLFSRLKIYNAFFQIENLYQIDYFQRCVFDTHRGNAFCYLVHKFRHNTKEHGHAGRD